MITRNYLFHGLKLTIFATEKVQTALSSRLGQFDVASGPASADLYFEYFSVPDLVRDGVCRPAGQGRSVLDVKLGSVLYFQSSQQLFIEVPGRASALCDHATRHVSVSYSTAEPDPAALLSQAFFTIPLAEMLKQFGLFMVHAAGMSLAGKGLLVAGQSGAGKTTLTLALLRGGFEFLADDTVFLTGKNRIMAFPDECAITAQTAEFFPELQLLQGVTKTNGTPKHPFCVSRLFGIKPCWECLPQVIVFPKPSPVRQSILTPMPKADALIELMCNVLRTEPHASQAHLDALATLVKSCQCYRLQTGRDFDHLPTLLKSVMLPVASHYPQPQAPLYPCA
jgi:hypothetical protein